MDGLGAHKLKERPLHQDGNDDVVGKIRKSSAVHVRNREPN